MVGNVIDLLIKNDQEAGSIEKLTKYDFGIIGR